MSSNVVNSDTGSCEFQITLLTAKINNLAKHFAIHKKDNHSKMGLLYNVSLRKKLIAYLFKKDKTKYRDVLEKLNLRSN